MKWAINPEAESDLISVCRHFPECPFTPSPYGDCPGCRAGEQYLDDSPDTDARSGSTSRNTRL